MSLNGVRYHGRRASYRHFAVRSLSLYFFLYLFEADRSVSVYVQAIATILIFTYPTGCRLYYIFDHVSIGPCAIIIQ